MKNKNERKTESKSVSLPTDLWKRADERAGILWKDRSEFIKDLIIKELEQEVLPL